MFDEKALKAKTVKELKSIAKENTIAVPTKAKKNDIIQLILEAQKVSETAAEKKKDLEDNPSSGQGAPENKTPQPFFNDIPELPEVYGKNKLVFMVRDPLWGFVYWEMNENLYNEHNLTDQEKYLRIYDISSASSPEDSDSYFDIKINDLANNWYIKFPQSNKTYIVDLGYFKDGTFVTVMRSNPATTPREDVSDQIDEEWMLTGDQFATILRASGADELFQQIGSQELMKFLAGNVSEENSLSSGFGMTSPGSLSGRN